jgi:hypothetical protein
MPVSAGDNEVKSVSPVGLERAACGVELMSAADTDAVIPVRRARQRKIKRGLRKPLFRYRIDAYQRVGAFGSLIGFVYG